MFLIFFRIFFDFFFFFHCPGACQRLDICCRFGYYFDAAHLKIAFLCYFTQFRITALASFSAKFKKFLTGSVLFPVIFTIEL